MATQMLCRLFPKTLTLTAISFLRPPLSASLLLPPFLPHSVNSTPRPPSPRFLSLYSHVPPPSRNPSPFKLRLLVRMVPPYAGFLELTEDEMTEYYVKILADVVGSLDEARRMVYSCSRSSVSSRRLCIQTVNFGTVMCEEIYDRVKVLPSSTIRIMDIHCDHPLQGPKVVWKSIKEKELTFSVQISPDDER